MTVIQSDSYHYFAGGFYNLVIVLFVGFVSIPCVGTMAVDAGPWTSSCSDGHHSSEPPEALCTQSSKGEQVRATRVRAASRQNLTTPFS